MKTPLDAPPEQIKAETSAKPEKATASVIDTSKMSAGKAAALDLAESSRDPLDERGSFASNLFIGKFAFDRIFPWPEQSAEDRAAGEPFLAELKAYLHANVDADEIDRSGEIPQKNIDDLFAMGAFAIKIPKQYGGLGLSQVNYGRAAMLARKLGCEPDRARLRAPIDRCAAAVAAFRHGRTKGEIFAASCAP